MTAIDTHVGGSNVFDLDDPELFKCPMAYISEPGFWTMSEAEVRGLRNYFLKGGFVIFDDFEAEQWHNFEAQVRRALPEYRLIEVDATHSIYHVFFDIKSLDFPHPLVDVVPRYYAIFEENDPRRRMMAIVNYNNDVAEYWEWSDTGFLSMDFTNEAYKLGGELHRLRAHPLIDGFADSWTRSGSLSRPVPRQGRIRPPCWRKGLFRTPLRRPVRRRPVRRPAASQPAAEGQLGCPRDRDPRQA